VVTSASTQIIQLLYLSKKVLCSALTTHFSFFSKVKRNRMICIKTFSSEEWRILILVSVCSEKNSRVYAICASSSHSFLLTFLNANRILFETNKTNINLRIGLFVSWVEWCGSFRWETKLATDGKIGQWLLVFIQRDELLRVVVLNLLD
jgi:hypothetical protein